MKRKFAFFVAAFLFLFAIAFFTGAAIKPVRFEVSITIDGETAFEKTYRVSASVAFASRLFYDGNPRNMLKKRFKDNIRHFSDTVNPDIASDIKSFSESVSYPAVEPSVEYKGKGKFVFFDGKDGKKCDYEKTLRSVAENKKSEAVFYSVPPTETIENLKANASIAGTAKTSYYTSGKARKINVELAAKRLDGKVVMPGERLSFNDTVGKRTVENGFVEAKVILYGEYADGIGGGVCQVSTTLYNAWLKSGLNALCSRPHSLEPSYVTPGLDAMVSEQSDLVLINDSSFPAYIGAFFDGSYLEFIVYTRSLPCTVKLASEFIRAIPCNEYDVTQGETDEIVAEPKNGAIYRSYRDFFVDGELVVRETLRTSTYLPQRGKLVKKTPNKGARLCS